MSYAACQATRADPDCREAAVGVGAEGARTGARLFGARLLTAKRTRPCWAVPLTLGNSPPSAT